MMYMRHWSFGLPHVLRGIGIFFLAAGILFGTAAAQILDHPKNHRAPRIFLMGEIHDNPHAHSLRLQHVMRLISDGHRPVVAMEQFDRDQQDVLDLALLRCQDVDCVLAAAGGPGWTWAFYKPLLQLALDKKITLMAANVSSTEVRKVMREGWGAVFKSEWVTAYTLHHIPQPLLDAQRQAIQEGHCNLLPPQAIGPMVKGQIARDVWMAHLINNTPNRMVILIAGNGHVRKDAGVFQWLSAENQKQTQVLGYVERLDKNDAQWFDQAVLVPEAEREDPCKAFNPPPDKSQPSVPSK